MNGHYVREGKLQSFIYSQFKQTSIKQNHLVYKFLLLYTFPLYDIHPLILYKPLQPYMCTFLVFLTKYCVLINEVMFALLYYKVCEGSPS